MMSPAGAFAYAQARLQARHGMRPDDGVWRQLAAVRDLAHFLQRARGTVLQPWVAGIASATPWHEIEIALRRDYRDYVSRVAAWEPLPWRPAIGWFAVLPDLPALRHLLTGDPPPDWMRADPALRPFVHDRFASRRAALEDSVYAPLLRGLERGLGLREAWLAHWRRLWPRAPRATLGGLEALTQRVLAHLDAVSRLSPGADAGPLRARLDRDLRRGLRRHVLQPAAAAHHLALVGLDLHRLRAELAQRVLFAEGAA